MSVSSFFLSNFQAQFLGEYREEFAHYMLSLNLQQVSEQRKTICSVILLTFFDIIKTFAGRLYTEKLGTTHV